MKKFFSLFLLLSVLLIPATGCYAKGPWKGKVIDSETKQPLEGAAVVAIWNKKFIVPTGAGKAMLDAKEAITDKNGEFEIPKSTYLSIPFLREVQDPTFTFYKPGYSTTPKQVVTKIPLYPYPYRTQSPSDYFQTQGTIVELPKAITKEQRIEALHNAEFDLDYLRKAKLKNILRLINEENIHLGFKGYREEK